MAYDVGRSTYALHGHGRPRALARAVLGMVLSGGSGDRGPQQQRGPGCCDGPPRRCPHTRARGHPDRRSGPRRPVAFVAVAAPSPTSQAASRSPLPPVRSPGWSARFPASYGPRNRSRPVHAWAVGRRDARDRAPGALTACAPGPLRAVGITDHRAGDRAGRIGDVDRTGGTPEAAGQPWSVEGSCAATARPGTGLLGAFGASARLSPGESFRGSAPCHRKGESGVGVSTDSETSTIWLMSKPSMSAWNSGLARYACSRSCMSSVSL